MKKIGLVLGVLLVAVGGYWLSVSGGKVPSDQVPANEDPAMVSISLPAEFSSAGQIGQTTYNVKCVACHGPNGVGQNGVAPPLIHKIYEPSHHGDESFQRAAALGVRSHHWSFGDMPAVEGLTRGDVANVITYIREIQRANGIK